MPLPVALRLGALGLRRLAQVRKQAA